MKVSFCPLECSCSTRRALCLLHVELDPGWRILWSVVCTCRLYVDALVELELELELKNPVGLLRVE